jgi:hypothetical protein
LGEERRTDRRLEKTVYLAALKFVLFPKYNQNDQVNEEEMDRVCRTNGEKRNA